MYNRRQMEIAVAAARGSDGLNASVDLGAAEHLLYRWGDWSRHGLGTGYPTESPIGRIMREGPGAGHIGPGAAIEMAPEIEFCERTVAGASKPIRQALKAKFIWRMNEKDGSKRLKCSRRSFTARVESGVLLVGEALQRKG